TTLFRSWLARAQPQDGVAEPPDGPHVVGAAAAEGAGLDGQIRVLPVAVVIVQARPGGDPRLAAARGPHGRQRVELEEGVGPRRAVVVRDTHRGSHGGAAAPGGPD